MDHKNHVTIDPRRCKGCGVCVSACPKKCLAMSDDINWMGVPYAVESADGCTACGFCFLSCPEIGAITVYKLDQVAEVNA